MKIKTSELIGDALDWATAVADGEKHPQRGLGGGCVINHGHTMHWYCPSSEWSHGGPIIERGKINLVAVDELGGPGKWAAEDGSTTFSVSSNSYDGEPVITFAEISMVFGPTPLIAAMRCYVASKLGDDVDIPDELCPKGARHEN